MTRHVFRCRRLLAGAALLAALAAGLAPERRSFDVVADAQSEADVWGNPGRPKGGVELADAKTEADVWRQG
jgi:hypothetical protein